jgi:tRNA-dihydrouridine synthase
MPLMLAPMQGLTNRALRAVYGEHAPPDVLFTEFVRVRQRGRHRVAPVDFEEATARVAGISLVVQVIGSLDDGVVEATRDLVERGVEHINVNMGCPWGRMTSILAGGGMFRFPESVEPLLAALRPLVPGSLSVKTRLGIGDPDAIFDLLPAFENAGVDFLVVHARTVDQKYRGAADHGRTARLVQSTHLPIIANGDIRDAPGAQQILEKTGAAGLMVGRGAIFDPHIFARMRGVRGPRPQGAQRQEEVADHLHALLEAYRTLFHGDAQVLAKMREVLVHLDDPELRKWIKALRKKKKVAHFAEVLRQPF